MKPRYKIVITEFVEETTKAGKEWKPVRAGEPSEYAYTPEIEKSAINEYLIYSQNVTELDMDAVIIAVNGLTILN